MAHILAVDDSATMRQMVAITLRDAGFEVTHAIDGLQALEIAEKQTFQLVLTDMHMPRMDGVALIKELRKLNSYRFTPILMLTTESTVEKKLEGKAAGATGWLVKPFEPTQLIRTIQKVLG